MSAAIPSPSPTAALFFDPDGYLLTGPKLMGRQSAGNAFLRAATLAHPDTPLSVYATQIQSARIFADLIKSFNPRARAQWIPADRVDLVARVGTLFFPGPGLGDPARLRLRVGTAAYSLVGVTHTLASHTAMDNILDLINAPVMPWDALICTSRAGGASVKCLLEAQIEYLNWRFGSLRSITLPQLPVIPLGVHCADFEHTPAEREAARRSMGIGPAEVVVLFVGRLSFHAKAHPHPMYLGLQAAAERSGAKITLIQSGAFANEFIGEAFKQAASQFCPGVNCLFSDGKDFAAHRRCWAAADVFMSLSDNIQETFGLTPIEAMAAGLPVVVSDWDGYKDTVREGIDGFRIPTWMPPANLGEPYARAYEAGIDNYDFYSGLNCQTVSVDAALLAERLTELVKNPALRQHMGACGRERARQQYDWAVIYRQYQTLWTRLTETRQAAASDPQLRPLLTEAPRVAPGRMDPYHIFAHYPTRLIQTTTRVSRTVSPTAIPYSELLTHGLYNYAGKILPHPDVAERLLRLCQQSPLTVAQLASQSGLETGQVALVLAPLAKMGLVRLED